MKDFKRGGFGGGDRGDRGGFKPSFGSKKPWDSKPKSFGDKSDRPMYQATCTSCGKPCQVPFKPVSGKDVLCNDCFAKARGEEVFVRDERPTRVSYGDRSSFRSNDRDARPSYNDRGASKPWENKSSAPTQGNNDQVLKQLTSVSAKLDQLISLMAISNNKAQASKPAEVTPAPVAKETKVAKKAAAPKKVVAKAVKKVSKKK
jgi:CxxC-x17-CxxC domain-containing protein